MSLTPPPRNMIKWKNMSEKDRRREIESRVKMPDGTIVSGRRGIEILDQRRRRQEEAMRYGLNQESA